MSSNVSNNKTIKELIKFGIVGLLNNIVYLIIYYILLSIGINYIISNIIAFLVSVLNAFIWNKNFVFKLKGNVFSSMIKTYVSYGVTLLLGTICIFILVEYLKVGKSIAPIICLFLTVPVNFILNKYWSMR